MDVAQWFKYLASSKGHNACGTRLREMSNDNGPGTEPRYSSEY